RAVDLYREAIEAGNWPADRRRELSIGLADALANAGRGAAAAPHYLAAADGAGAAQALDLRRPAPQEPPPSRHLRHRPTVAAGALKEAGLSFARRPLLVLAWERLLLGARGRRFRRRSPEEIAPSELARTDLCWSLSSGLGLTDPIQGAHFQTRSLLLALRS